MNIYCPHCGKKNSYGVKSCAGCSGNLNSLGAVRPPTQQQTFAPVIVNTPEEANDTIPGTKSAYLAKRAARKGGEARVEDTPGAPVIVRDDDDDEGVQHFDASKFSGVLQFTAESTQEDATRERISFQLPAPTAPASKSKRGRKPGSKNKK